MFLNMVSAGPRSTWTAASTQASLETATEAFWHEPIDNWVETAETITFVHIRGLAKLKSKECGWSLWWFYSALFVKPVVLNKGNLHFKC